MNFYPHVDDKILTSWNAMMIEALAYAGSMLQQKKYIEAAVQGISFIETHLFDNGRLMARYRDEETKFKAYLDDYAYLIAAYISLYEATFDLIYLKKAKQQAEKMLTLFWDQDHGGFFQTGSDAEELINREKEIFDGALPSGNSIAAFTLTKLGALTGDHTFRDKVEEMYYSFYEQVHDYPAAATFFMTNLFHTDFPKKEVVVIGEKHDTVRVDFLKKLQTNYLPNVNVLVAEHAESFHSIAPFAVTYTKMNDKTTFYVCENFSCQQPTNDLHEALHHIGIN